MKDREEDEQKGEEFDGVAMAPLSFDPTSPKQLLTDQATVSLLPSSDQDQSPRLQLWKYPNQYPCFAWGFYCLSAAAAALAMSLVYCIFLRSPELSAAATRTSSAIEEFAPLSPPNLAPAQIPAPQTPACQTPAPQAEMSRPLKLLDKPLVILISSDGFRWGYQWKVPTPNIDRLRLNGTEAEPGMIPVYPSLTFPNHYSIATGLYPAWHGIISNYFHYPEANGKTDVFYMGNLNPKWWLGEPIWETVAKAGLKAATYFWPGSEVVKGVWNCPALFCQHYNGSVPYEDRVDTVLGYLDLPPSERPSFMTLYFETPDKQGHEVGPDAPQIRDAVARIDAMIGRLLDGLDKRNLFEEVNIIMVGDHGMVGTCDKKLIYLSELSPWINIPSDWIDSTSPVLAIRPPSDVDAKEVVKSISQGLSSGKVQNGEFLKVHLKEDLPNRLHYSDSDRIHPIIGLIAEAFKVESKKSRAKECGGAHGYDNEFASMRTIFIGHGPRFARGRKVASFENVELYNVMTSILGIEPAPNNGSMGFAKSLLLP